MKIVIVGDGKVGFALTQQLAREDHDIVVIDSNKMVLKESQQMVDIQVVHGNGASPVVQSAASVGESDLMIAATSADEINLLCCIVAKKLGCSHTIARVRNPEYYGQFFLLKDELGLNLMINPERATASEIFRLLQFPSFLKRDAFAKGRVEIVEVVLRPESHIVGKLLSELYHTVKVKVLVCAVERGNDVVIPDGSFRLLTGNQIGCLMLYYILSCKKAQGKLPANGAVVKSIVSTELARAICKDFGVALFDTLTGFKFIGEKIQQFQDTGSHTFLFGFEESYGYLSSTFVRDKDGVNASLLIAEAACYYSTQGKTLCDVMAEIFQRYGYYLEHVESTTLPGIDGLKVMAEIMARIRKNPPVEIGGVKVARVLDIMAGTETDVATGKVTKLDYPESDVLYFAMEGGHFVCVRPSGTEPKIKLYVNVNDPDQARAQELLEHLTAEAQKLLK